MRIADRDIRRIARAPFEPRHWLALARFFSTFDDPVAALARYVANRGAYPWPVSLRTPLGRVPLTLRDRHDLLTVVEIFCRRDYGSSAYRTVVDIGANVGIATLFFLTRSDSAHVWAFEPDPANVAQLRETLTAFEGRYTLEQCAVTAGEASSVHFVPAGRYGRIARGDEAAIEVPATSIASVLRTVGAVDLLKIDTEGTEEELVAAIPADAAVGEIRYETNDGRVAVVSAG